MSDTATATTAPRPPGPSGWPLIGVAGEMRPERSLAAMRRWHAEYGDVFRIPLPMGRGMVVVAHPDLLEQVLLKRRKRYVKGDAYDSVRRLMGDSLVTLEGDAHKVRRRIAQPAFHRRSLTKLVETMVSATTRWFDGLQQRMGAGGVLEVHREMTHVTLEIVVECLFGKGFYERTNVSYEQLSQALELISEGANGLPLPDWVPTPGNLRFQRVIKALNADVNAIIGAAREAVERGEDDGSLLQMLLRSRDAETGEALSDQAVRDEVVTLFIAGHETTALTMTWFFDLVTERPEVIAALRSEVEEVLGERVPDFDTLMQLKGAQRVIDEVLRMRPAAPWVGRNVAEDDVLGGFQLLKGDLVLPNIWLAHYHPEFWQRPDDFDPDRFLPEATKARHNYAFLPFSVGPRMCIGNVFSYVETKAIIVELVRRCSWKRAGPRAEPRPIATLRPSNEVRIELSFEA